MSRASDFAATILASDADAAEAESSGPEGFTANGVKFDVTEEGGLHVDKEAMLSHDDALALGNWLILNFGQ